MEAHEMGVIAVCHSDRDRQHLRAIRKFWGKNGSSRPDTSIPKLLRLSDSIDVVDDLKSAAERLLCEPRDNILVTLGYPETEIREFFNSIHAPLQVAGRAPRQRKGIASRRGSGNGSAEEIWIPSASLFRDKASTPSIIFSNDPIAALRKAAIRQWTRQNVKVRLLEEDNFDAYFSLRYKVWRELDYIPHDRICEKSEWEVDFTDRSSIPIGGFLFDQNTGCEELVACGRLVSPLGKEEVFYRDTIERHVDIKSRQTGEERLKNNYEYPPGLAQPFDILESFEGFWEYFAQITQQRISKAEVSRIIVKEGYRNQGIGEVIVDSLIELAQEKKIHLLFLACTVGHRNFYNRCGFSEVPGIGQGKFGIVRTPAIVMHREIPKA